MNATATSIPDIFGIVGGHEFSSPIDGEGLDYLYG